MPFSELPPTTLALLILALVGAGSAVLLMLEIRSQRLARRLNEAAGQTRRPRETSRLPGIQLVQRNPTSLSHRLGRLIAFNPARPQEHPAPWPIVLLFAVAGGVVSGVLIAVVLGRTAAIAGGAAATLLIARAAFAYGTSNYREQLFKQMPDAMGMIVRALRAGIPVTEAIRTIARECPEPTRREFAQVNAEQAIGVSIDVSLLNLYNRTGLREYGFFAVTITLQQQTGGSLTETLDNLADVVRKRVQTAARGRALAGQARMSAVILTVIPFVALGALSVLNPGYLQFYFTHEKGPTLAAIAFGMLGFGVLTMRGMIRRSLAVT
ncbi:type II secretion system F family protein [Elioraea sp.]|jgi:tight adherence protein B|uniref:type II secretion system F family protein n=1 Tax=Elioraea sp. TaxID=2185103 RepID=UPI003F7195D4